MRALFLMLAVFASASTLGKPAQARDYPWCAQYSRGGGRNCGFVTFQQCLATVQGIGGFCEQNQLYQPSMPARPRRYRHEG